MHLGVPLLRRTAAFHGDSIRAGRARLYWPRCVELWYADSG
jgi:hypothetical protein